MADELLSIIVLVRWKTRIRSSFRSLDSNRRDDHQLAEAYWCSQAGVHIQTDTHN